MRTVNVASPACSRAYMFRCRGLQVLTTPVASRRILLVTVLFAAITGIPARVRAQGPADDGEEENDISAGIVLDTAAFEARLAQSEALVRNNQATVQVGGYVDFGFFVPQGNGAGYIEDFGHTFFPQYAGHY